KENARAGFFEVLELFSIYNNLAKVSVIAGGDADKSNALPQKISSDPTVNIGSTPICRRYSLPEILGQAPSVSEIRCIELLGVRLHCEHRLNTDHATILPCENVLGQVPLRPWHDDAVVHRKTWDLVAPHEDQHGPNDRLGLLELQ